MLAMERSKSLPHLKMLFGGDSCGDPPVPIPNTEVKPAGADGTWGADPWESRKPPNALVGAARTTPRSGRLFFSARYRPFSVRWEAGSRPAGVEVRAKTAIFLFSSAWPRPADMGRNLVSKGLNRLFERPPSQRACWQARPHRSKAVHALGDESSARPQYQRQARIRRAAGRGGRV